ncbi:MAG: hypothetical protein AAF664_23405, partial [Planctomycetota bacterium]
GAAALFGLDQMETSFRADLESNPVFLEQVGEIETFSSNFMETIAASQDDEPRFVYDVKGSNGSGKVYIKQGPAENGKGIKIIEAELVMDDGETFLLVPSLEEGQSGWQPDPLGEEAISEPSIP